VLQPEGMPPVAVNSAQVWHFRLWTTPFVCGPRSEYCEGSPVDAQARQELQKLSKTVGAQIPDVEQRHFCMSCQHRLSKPGVDASQISIMLAAELQLVDSG
jgi:hypothetical protein